jgi:quinol monooxygenase YgiN
MEGTVIVRAGLFVRLEARPGKEEELSAFLRSALAFVQDEPGKAVWLALRFGPASFGIFDAFPDDAGRQVHLDGPLTAALLARAAKLLSTAPTIEKVDALAGKLN